MSDTDLHLGFHPEEHAPDPIISHGDPIPAGKLAIWLFLATEVMFFSGSAISPRVRCATSRSSKSTRAIASTCPWRSISNSRICCCCRATKAPVRFPP